MPNAKNEEKLSYTINKFKTGLELLPLHCLSAPDPLSSFVQYLYPN